MFKRKKKNKIEDVEKQEVNNISVEELQRDINDLMLGYYNLNTMLKSEGIITRKNNNFKIDVILRDNILLGMYGLFDYENLPKEIPSYKIEELLFGGEACFFEMGGEYYVSKYIVMGDRDRYNMPITIQPQLENGRTLKKRKVGKDIVIIRNSFSGLSTFHKIESFINRCALNYEASMNNLKMSMTKWLVHVKDEKLLKEVKREVEKLLNTSGSVAFSHGMYDVENIPFFDDFDSANYWEDFHATLNFIYNLIGVNTNPNEDKKERLIVDEVNINENKVGLILEAMFKSRLEAIKQINEMFGLDIKLKMYVNYDGGDDGGNEYKNNIIE